MNRVSNLFYNIWDKLSQGIIQMFSANVLNNVIGMIGNMIITRMLSKMEYGIWSYVLNIYSYLVLLNGFGLLSGAFQFGAENRGKKEEFQYFKFCLKAGMIIDTVLIALFVISTFIISFSISEATIYLRVVAPMLLLEYIFNLMLTVLRCEGRIREYAKILNINTILLMSGTCGGSYFGVMGVIAGKYAAYILSVIQIMWNLRAELKKIKIAETILWKHTKELWNYSIFTGISSALNCLLFLLDVSMIAAMIQEPLEVATYKVATLIPNALVFIPNSVIVSVLPDIVSNNKNYHILKTKIKKIFIGLGILNLIVCGCCILFAPLIIQILSGKQYLSAVPVFRILVLSYFVGGTFRSMSVNILAALRRVKYGLFISISSGVCNIGFNYIFIRKMGALGAAYATLGVSLVAAILSFGYLIYILMNSKNANCFR